MRIGNREFDFDHKSYVMGIVNVTPDSFSDGGCYHVPEAALAHAMDHLSQGAAIIDIGGESTRPGYQKISIREEIDRVVPVIRMLKEKTDAVVSLDTYKYEVARAGIEAGADLINDIWGLRYDSGEMAGLLARYQMPCCLMHNRKDTLYSEYPDFLTGFCAEIDETLAIARRAGIQEDKIILDPGIGFGKTYEQNLTVMKNLSLMKKWELPVLLGVSRKSMIGIALDLPVTQREEGTLAANVMGRLAGAAVFRVHDVEKNVRALQMVDTILQAEER